MRGFRKQLFARGQDAGKVPDGQMLQRSILGDLGTHPLSAGAEEHDAGAFVPRALVVRAFAKSDRPLAIRVGRKHGVPHDLARGLDDGGLV